MIHTKSRWEQGDDMMHLGRAPVGALVFGFAGVAPFALAAAAIHAYALGVTPLTQNIDNANFAAHLLVLWGGLILAFLGGTRWGRAVGVDTVSPGVFTFASAAFPSLVAWIGVAVSLPPLDQPALGASVLVGGYLHMLLWDLQSVREGVWPKWYSALRIILTALAAAALITGGLGALRYL